MPLQRTPRTRRTAAFAAVLATATLWASTAPPAQAGLLDGPRPSLPGPLATPLDPALDLVVDPLLGAVGTVTGPLTDALCEVVDGVGGATGLPDCPVDVSFRSRLPGQDLGAARLHPATVGVPTALDVDDDVAPDVVATLGLTDGGRLGLSVTRHPLQLEPLPVAVEAVVSDPGPVVGDLLPADVLTFGYDARADRAPGDFELSVRLTSLAERVLDLGLAQRDPGARIAVVASLVDGSLAAPEGSTGLSLDYLTSPSEARIQVGLDDPRRDLSATLTQASRGTVVVGTVVDRDGADADAVPDARTTATVTIDDVPASLSVDLLRPRDGVLEVDYAASARVGTLAATLRRDVLPIDDARDEQLELVLTDLAPSLDLAVDSSGETVSSTAPPEDHLLVTVAGDPASAPGATSVGSITARTVDFGAVPDLDLTIADVPRDLVVCFDRGSACRREEGRARMEAVGYDPVVSLDAVSSHTDGFVTIDATVDVVRDGATTTLSVQDLRFRELAVDLARGPDREIFRRDLPRIALFLDADDQPFVLGALRFDPVQQFSLGTVANPARAQDRFLWVKDYSIIDGLLLRGAVVQERAGTLSCGGARALVVRNVNLLDFSFASLSPVDLCSS